MPIGTHTGAIHFAEFWKPRTAGSRCLATRCGAARPSGAYGPHFCFLMFTWHAHSDAKARRRCGRTGKEIAPLLGPGSETLAIAATYMHAPGDSGGHFLHHYRRLWRARHH